MKKSQEPSNRLDFLRFRQALLRLPLLTFNLDTHDFLLKKVKDKNGFSQSPPRNRGDRKEEISLKLRSKN